MSTPTKIMVLLTTFGQRRAVPLIILILIVAMNGAQARSRHSLSAAQPASDSQAWSDLQRSMLAMHGAMSSIRSAGNDDEDFVRLMIPHHQAALDMARVELMHGQDPQMRRLAQEIVADQESEIELMQLWLRRSHAQKTQPSPSAAKEQ
jgi:uncharacterized protein (DUF305 family)